MAWMNQESKKVISQNVKPILKKYGLKGSLSVRNHMTIVLTLTSGSIDFVGDLPNETVQFGQYEKVDKEKLRKDYHLSVNPYWYNEHYKKDSPSQKFLSEIFPALRSAGWYDNSDASVDYFDTAYYVDVNIGKWNKPYTLVTT